MNTPKSAKEVKSEDDIKMPESEDDIWFDSSIHVRK